MSASNQTYTVCSASPGNGMPQAKRTREIEMSSSPSSSTRITSFRRMAGADLERAGADQLQHPRAPPAQPEEVVPLAPPLEVAARMLDAAPVHDLRLLLELLAADAVESLVLADVDIVGVVLPDQLDEAGDRPLVPLLGGADPVVVGAEEPGPGPREALGDGGHPRLGRHPRLLGRLRDLLAVLVHPHEETHVVAAEAPVPGDAVRADLLERVAEMRVAVGVVDGGRDEEAAHERLRRSAGGGQAGGRSAHRRPPARPPARPLAPPLAAERGK